MFTDADDRARARVAVLGADVLPLLSINDPVEHVFAHLGDAGERDERGDKGRGPRARNRRRSTDDDVTASELAAFAYCAKAWHLENVVGARPTGGAARRRDAGVAHHVNHGTDVLVGAWLGGRAVWLLISFLARAVLFGSLAVLVR